MAGLVAGVVTSLCTVFVLSKIMGLTHEDYVTMLPKSITTAIGMGVSEELGGYVTITVAVIIVTGVLGNIFGVQDFSNHRTDIKGSGIWICISCDRNGKGDRDR